MNLLVQASLLLVVTLGLGVPWFSRRAKLGFELLGLSYAAHLAGALMMAYLQINGMGGDAIAIYHPTGQALADGTLDWGQLGRAEGFRYVGTAAISALTGLWYSAFGASIWGMYLLAGTVSFFTSCILAYDAYLLYGSARRRRLVVWLALFLPSFLVWNSLFGKEPVAAVGTALTVHGTVLVGRRKNLPGAAAFLFGVTLLAFVRPHFAAISATALAAAMLFARRRTPLQIVLGVASLFALLAGGMRFVSEYVGIEAISAGAIASRIAKQSQVMQIGSSASGIAVEAPGIGGLVMTLPLSIAAMLVMPIPIGSLDPLQLLAGAETLFVLAVLLRNGVGAIRRTVSGREIPLLYGWMYAVIFLLLLSVPLAANFGLMVRQRTVLWIPLLFVALAGRIPRASSRKARDPLLRDLPGACGTS